MANQPDYQNEDSFENLGQYDQDEGVSSTSGFREDEDDYLEEGTAHLPDDYINNFSTYGQDENVTTRHSDSTPINESEPLILFESSMAQPSAPPIPQTRVTESTPPPTSELFEPVSYSTKSQQDKGFSERPDEKVPAVPASWMKNVDPREEVEGEDVISPHEHQEEAVEKINLEEATSDTEEVLNEAAEVEMLVTDASSLAAQKSVVFSDEPEVSQAYRKDSLEEEKDESDLSEEEGDMFGEGPEADNGVYPTLVSTGISEIGMVVEAESDAEDMQDTAGGNKSDSSQGEVKGVDDKEFEDSSSEDLGTTDISDQDKDVSPVVDIEVSFEKQTDLEAGRGYEEGRESPLGSMSDGSQEKAEVDIAEELEVSGGAEYEAINTSKPDWQNEKEFIDENIYPESQNYTDESPKAYDSSSDEGIEPGQIEDITMPTELGLGVASQDRDSVIPVQYSQQVFSVETAERFSAKFESDKSLVDIAEDDVGSERLDSNTKDPTEFVQESADASVSHQEKSAELKSQQQAPEHTNDEELKSWVEEPVVSSTSEEAPAVTKEVHFTEVWDLIYWRDVKKTGVVFGSMMFVLLSLVFFSLLSVLAYLELAILSVTFTFRLYKSVMQAVQKTNEGHPFRKYLEMDLNLKEAVVEKAAENIAKNLNNVLGELRRLFLVQDIVDSLKFGMLLYLLTYIGCWFNGMTLVIMAVVAIFTLPKVYDTYKITFISENNVRTVCGKEYPQEGSLALTQTALYVQSAHVQIDSHINLIRCQLNKILTQIQSKIPFPKKKEKAQ